MAIFMFSMNHILWDEEGEFGIGGVWGQKPGTGGQ